MKPIILPVRYGEKCVVSGSEFTIDTESAWHMLSQFVTGTIKNLEAELGSFGAITAFAEGSPGQVVVTSAAHGIAENDFLSITGTATYNGLFAITNVTTDTFEITAGWVEDDAEGTWHHGSHIVIPAGGSGDYKCDWAMSMTSVSANQIYDFSVVHNATTNGIISRKVTTGGDVGAIAGTGIMPLSEGDHLTLAVRNVTSTSNFTVTDGCWSIQRIG